MASRKTEVRGHVDRPMLSPEYALFLRLRWGGWNFLVGLMGLVLPQIPAKKGMLLQLKNLKYLPPQRTKSIENKKMKSKICSRSQAARAKSTLKCNKLL